MTHSEYSNTKPCFKSIGEKLLVSTSNLPGLSKVYYHFIYFYMIPDFKRVGKVNLQNQTIGQFTQIDDRDEHIVELI